MTHTEFFIAFAILLAAGCTKSQKPADVVIRNGTIYTANDKQPTAEALAASDGKILFVGSAADVAAYVGPNTKVIDLKGNTATPGLTDSHYHLYGVGQRERTLNLEDTK